MRGRPPGLSDEQYVRVELARKLEAEASEILYTLALEVLNRPFGEIMAMSEIRRVTGVDER